MGRAAPTEAQEQRAVVEWLSWMGIPFYHVPNGGYRHEWTAWQLKAQGVSPGVPDLCIPVARGGYHGLYVEMKRLRGGRLSAAQRRWIDLLRAEGYMAEVCSGADEAIGTIAGYMKGDDDGKDRPRGAQRGAVQGA